MIKNTFIAALLSLSIGRFEFWLCWRIDYVYFNFYFKFMSFLLLFNCIFRWFFGTGGWKRRFSVLSEDLHLENKNQKVRIVQNKTVIGFQSLSFRAHSVKVLGKDYSQH